MLLLDVDPTMEWHDIRARYRELIRQVHPDVDPSDVAHRRAAALNDAIAVLASATRHGRDTLALDPDAARPPGACVGDARRPDAADAAMTLRARAGDVFVQLLDAAHEIGDVAYIDPEAGIIQVLLDQRGPAAAQLLIALDTDTNPPLASFQLDSMDATNAPRIADVVASLGTALAAG